MSHLRAVRVCADRARVLVNASFSEPAVLPRPFGPYQLIKHIASGGMAEIYLAKTAGVAGFEKYLAVKMIRENLSDDQEFVDMLVAEAKIAVLLAHPNIVQVFDLGLVEGRYYIAMEFVDGFDLHSLLVRTAELDTYVPFAAAAYIIREACAGLHYAHERRDPDGRELNIVHRDISPQNLLLGFGGEVKLADFGIAKANIARNETQVGIIKGKFCYMSPEQAWGDKLDGRSDVFALGVVLYELLTGEMMYKEQDQIRLLDLVRQSSIPPPSLRRAEVPSSLEAICMQALERDRRQRFQSAAHFQRELSHYLASHSPGYCQTDLATYVRETLAQQPVAPPLEVSERPRDTNQPTRNVRIDVMARNDFVPHESASLVYSFNDVVNAAKAQVAARRPDQATAAVRVGARPGVALLGEGGAEARPGPTRGPASLERMGSGEERDDEEPTQAYSPVELDDVRRSFVPWSAPQLQANPEASWVPPERGGSEESQRAKGTPPLRVSEQGRYSEASESISLSSSDLQPVSIHDRAAARVSATGLPQAQVAPRPKPVEPKPGRTVSTSFDELDREDWLESRAAAKLPEPKPAAPQPMRSSREGLAPVVAAASTLPPSKRLPVQPTAPQPRPGQRPSAPKEADSLFTLWLLVAGVLGMGIIAVIVVLLIGF